MSSSSSTSSSSSSSSGMFVPIGQVADDVLRAPPPSDSGDSRAAGVDAANDGPPLRREINTADAVDRTGENANPNGKLGEDEEGRPQVHRVEGDVMVIKSLCVQCEEDGLTRLLLTRIPFFRDVILMAFECEHCGFRSSELQSAEFQEKGCRFELRATGPADMNRQLVKSDRATVRVEELDFEIPPNTQKGVFTTVEGVLDRARESLEQTQPLRRSLDPEGADAVEAFIERLKGLVEGNAFPFTLVLDDPSGNSFLENPHAPKHDSNLKVRHYTRSKEQNELLGLFADNARAGVSSATAGEGEGEGGSSSGSVAAAGGAGTSAAVEDDTADDSDLRGSSATTMFPSRDLDTRANPKLANPAYARGLGGGGDGNTPGAWVKGGALIPLDATERAAATKAARRGVDVSSSSTSSSSASAPEHPGRGGRRKAAPRVAAGASSLFESGLTSTTAADGTERELMRFPVDCTHCSYQGECCMAVTDVPHFKEVILMAFKCDNCGWKDVEVKGGGAVPPKGTITTLRFDASSDTATKEMDLSRDVIKGDTASIEIPELELQVERGSLGGLYTTVEGLLTLIKDKLLESDPYAAESVDSGGSAVSERRLAMIAFLGKLSTMIEGKSSFTLQLKDPMANSWIYSPYEAGVATANTTADAATAPAASGTASSAEASAAGIFTSSADPRLSHVGYQRSEDEDRELGLLDMKTEGYGEEDNSDDEEDEKEEDNKDGERDDQGKKEGKASGSSDANDRQGR